MTHPSSLSTADAVLWAAHGDTLRQLPTPTPLALFELPLARMQRRLTRPDVRTDLLPQGAWERFHSVRGPDGRHYAARIAGDPREGLAVQGDWSVLIALMGLYDAQGWRSPTLVSPPLRAIARLMRAEEGGVTAARIKAALVRFALTRVTLVPMRKGDDPGAVLARATVLEESSGLVTPGQEDGLPAIVSGVEDPPSPRTVAEALHGAPVGRVHGILDVEWGEAGIASVTLGRAWCPGEQAQPALWLETDRYFDLQDPLSRRLYLLLAANLARGTRGPWEPSLAWLRAAAGYDPELKRSRVLRELQEAAEELVRHGVVTDVTLAPNEGDPQVVSFTPGAALAVPRMLEGFGLTEPPDDRTALALLRAFGFAPEEARTALAERPERVREALCYVCFRRQSAQGARQAGQRGVDHPRAYLVKLLEGDQPFADDAFQRWYRALVARAAAARPALPLVRSGAEGGRRGSDCTALAPDARERAEPERRAQAAMHRARLTPDMEAAERLWSAAVAVLRADAELERAAPFFVAMLDAYVAYRITLGVLELGADSELQLRWATRPVAADALSAAVARASDGTVRTVRVATHASLLPRDRTGDAPAD